MSGTNMIETILIVDDEEIQVKITSASLKDAGYDVVVARDAPDGLQKAMDHPPDLILLDVMMPMINGYNFCKLIKTEARTQDVKVILCTSRDKLEDIEIGMEVGADAYLAKPINIKELLRTIQVVGSMDGSEMENPQ